MVERLVSQSGFEDDGRSIPLFFCVVTISRGLDRDRDTFRETETKTMRYRMSHAQWSEMMCAFVE